MKRTFPHSVKKTPGAGAAALALFALLGAPGAWAQGGLTCGGLFGAYISTGGSSTQVCTTTFLGLYETGIRDAGQLFPNYTSTSALRSEANFGGVKAIMNFGEGSSALSMVIPDLDVTQTFNGATREESAKLFRDYLRNNSDLVGRIHKRQAAISPLSPITGTGSAMRNAIGADFDAGFGETAMRIVDAQSGSSGTQNLIGMGVVVSQHKVAGETVRNVSVPLSYTVRNDIDPRRQALVRAGFGALDTAGTRTYQSRIAGGYRFPMSDAWALTPMAGFSVSGSEDAAFYVGVASASITSTYTWEFDGFDLTMGNMVGGYQTVKLGSRKYATDPNIRNVAFKNGVVLSQPVILGGNKMSAEYGLADTRLTGTDLYQKSMQELTFSLGTNRNALSSRSFFRATLAFQRARDSKGVTLSVNYWF